MGFYEEFIDKYDKLISWKNREKREKPFFKKVFSENKVKTVLDCACGTGQHTIMFDEMGIEAVGTDLSPAMVKEQKSTRKNTDHTQNSDKQISQNYHSKTSSMP